MGAVGMRYGSICSGIEAATVAWHPLGWEPVFFSEIEAFPRAVLAHHYQHVPLHGDFTTIKGDEYGSIDLLVGGTPCQSFSVAGLRGGLADNRGNLALEFLRLARRTRARWLVWENVPGVLSSNSGRDFGAILGGMVELGYGIAYRVLDAQYFGVPQRRRRVFVVGYSGDWRRAAAVLFERQSLRWNYSSRKKSRKDIAPTISARPTGGGGLGTDFDLDGGLDQAAVWPATVAPTLNAAFGSKQGLEDQHIRGGVDCSFPPNVSLCLNGGGMGRQDWETETLIPQFGGCFDVTHSLRASGFDASEDGTGRGTPIVPTLTSNGDAHSGYRDERGLVPGRAGVRRLTPRECERLQGFPDDYTLVPHRNKPAADGPRYKALGNSMAVPCMRWIGERIQMVNTLCP